MSTDALTSDALPPSWRTIKDDETDDRVLYINDLERTVQRTPPIAAWKSLWKAPDVPCDPSFELNALPPSGWEVAMDSELLPYYLIHKQQRTTRTLPGRPSRGSIDMPLDTDDPPESPLPKTNGRKSSGAISSDGVFTTTISRHPEFGYGFIAGGSDPVTIRSVDKGGPSARAKPAVRPGDAVMKIGDTDVSGAGMSEVVSLIKTMGDNLSITLCRKQKPNPKRKAPEPPKSAGTVLKVYFQDDFYKSVMATDKLTAEDLIQQVTEKLNMKSSKYFGLLVKNDGLQDIWISNTQTMSKIREIQPPGKGQLWLYIRYIPQQLQSFLNEDPNAFQFYFKQATQEITNRQLNDLTKEDALRLGSLHVQLWMTQNKKKKFDLEKIEKSVGLKHFFHTSFFEDIKGKELKRIIRNSLTHNQGASETELQVRYLQLCMQIRTFGGRFFKVVVDGEETDLLVGAKDGITRLVNPKVFLLTPIVDYPRLSRLEVKEVRKDGKAKLEIKLAKSSGSQHRMNINTDIILKGDHDVLEEMASFLDGYYRLNVNPDGLMAPTEEPQASSPKPMFKRMQSSDLHKVTTFGVEVTMDGVKNARENLASTKAPPYRGVHQVPYQGWNYVEKFEGTREINCDTSLPAYKEKTGFKLRKTGVNLFAGESIRRKAKKQAVLPNPVEKNSHRQIRSSATSSSNMTTPQSEISEHSDAEHIGDSGNGGSQTSLLSQTSSTNSEAMSEPIPRSARGSRQVQAPVGEVIEPFVFVSAFEEKDDEDESEDHGQSFFRTNDDYHGAVLVDNFDTFADLLGDDLGYDQSMSDSFLLNAMSDDGASDFGAAFSALDEREEEEPPLEDSEGIMLENCIDDDSEDEDEKAGYIEIGGEQPKAKLEPGKPQPQLQPKVKLESAEPQPKKAKPPVSPRPSRSQPPVSPKPAVRKRPPVSPKPIKKVPPRASPRPMRKGRVSLLNDETPLPTAMPKNNPSEDSDSDVDLDAIVQEVRRKSSIERVRISTSQPGSHNSSMIHIPPPVINEENEALSSRSSAIDLTDCILQSPEKFRNSTCYTKEEEAQAVFPSSSEEFGGTLLDEQTVIAPPRSFSNTESVTSLGQAEEDVNDNFIERGLPPPPDFGEPPKPVLDGAFDFGDPSDVNTIGVIPPPADLGGSDIFDTPSDVIKVMPPPDIGEPEATVIGVIPPPFLGESDAVAAPSGFDDAFDPTSIAPPDLDELDALPVCDLDMTMDISNIPPPAAFDLPEPIVPADFSQAIAPANVIPPPSIIDPAPGYSSDGPYSSESVVINEDETQPAYQACDIGQLACDRAIAQVDELMYLVESTKALAEGPVVGLPESKFDDEEFTRLKSMMWDESKNLVKSTRQLVTGAAHSQERLSTAADDAHEIMTSLCETAVHTAENMDRSEAQVDLLGGTHLTITACHEMLVAARAASGKKLNEQPMRILMEKAKFMAESISGLMKVLRSLEDL